MTLFSHERNIGSPVVCLPVNLEEAVLLKKTYGTSACYVSGGTLLRTQWESGLLPMPEYLISLDNIRDLNGIEYDIEHDISIGSRTLLKDCCKHPILEGEASIVKEACNQIAAPSIRNLATIGGNIVSGTGDSIPALLVQDAELTWMTENGIKEHKLSDWLSEVKEGTRVQGNILMKVSLPIQSQVDVDRDMKFKAVSFFQKVGRRESFTPSLVTVAFKGWLGEDGRWLSLSMATGGGSALAVRLRESECWLMERRYSPSLLPELAEVIAAEMTSYSDPFASERYRKQTAGNLLAAGLWESLKEETMRF